MLSVSRRVNTTLVITLASLLFVAVVAGLALASGTIERVSLSSTGEQANGHAAHPAISEDGRFVAFQSDASNLVPGISGQHVYVRDRQTGATTIVGVNNDGTPGDRGSGGYSISISGDGRYVAFNSNSSNLVPGDTLYSDDVFVHDRDTDADGTFDEPGAIATTMVSVAPDGNPGNVASAYPSISANGRYVTFESRASNLVPGDTNTVLAKCEHMSTAGPDSGEACPGEPVSDVFVRDLQAGTTVRVSVDSAGNQSNNDSHSTFSDISDGGRFVVFYSYATNLVGTDNNGQSDVFVRDRDADADGILDEVGAVTTALVSVDSNGVQGGGDSHYGAISFDGRYVAFDTNSALVPEDTNGFNDVYLRDRQSGTTTRVSLSNTGAQLERGGGRPSMSSDGRYITFSTSGVNDVSVRDVQAQTTTEVSVSSEGVPANRAAGGAVITGDGRYVAFHAEATNLVPNDTNNTMDIFVHDRLTEITSRTLPAGGTLSSDAEGDGATASDPVETSITSPNGGVLKMTETATTEAAPSGYSFLGQQVNLSGDPATVESPYVVTFRIDSSQIPVGENQDTIQVFRNGVEVAACSDTSGTASPNPCVSKRELLADGDIAITVLTAQFSAWNFGVRTVRYELKGFYHPVNMNGIANTAKAGSTIPIKFEVFEQGQELTDTSVVKSIGYKANTGCTTAAEDAIESLTETTGLRYVASSGQFVYGWQAPKTKGCYTVVVKTVDGSQLTALFELK